MGILKRIYAPSESNPCALRHAGVRRPTSKTLSHRSTHTALRTVSGGQKTGFSYLMDVYGRLRVREYNTLHRAIRKSSWGPVRCNIALHLRIQAVTDYSPSNPKTKTVLSSKDHAPSFTHYSVKCIQCLNLRATVQSWGSVLNARDNKRKIYWATKNGLDTFIW